MCFSGEIHLNNTVSFENDGFITFRKEKDFRYNAG
jgi:hypothetical protein